MLLFFAGCAVAGEYAVLAGGGRLRIERHEMDGENVKLYSKTGVTEMAANLVGGFEVDDAPVPEPAMESQAAAPAAPGTRALIDDAARRHGLPASLVHSVVAAESSYRAGAVSPKGAIGLMQLMPGTAKDLGADPMDPAQNVDAGTRYLRELLVKYAGRPELALAAYNAGPGAVDRYRGIPPYQETRTYVNRVLKKYQVLSQQ